MAKISKPRKRKTEDPGSSKSNCRAMQRGFQEGQQRDVPRRQLDSGLQVQQARQIRSDGEWGASDGGRM